MAETNQKQAIKIELTPEQREQIKRVLGKDVAELEFTAEELEERVAPTLIGNAVLRGNE